MNKLKTLALASVAVLGLSACSSVNHGVANAPLKTKLVSHNIANVKAGEKVMAESEAKVILGFITLSEDNKYADGVNYAGDSGVPGMSFFDTTSKVKAAAAYKAVKKANADVLLAPVYETEENNYFLWKDVKTTVSAYAGKITGIKSQK